MAGPSPHDAAPRWLRRAAWIASASVGLFVLALLVLALGGISDVPAAGPLTVDEPLGLVLAADAPNTRRADTLLHDLAPPLTVEVTARQVGGDPEARYGVQIGDANNGLSVALNGHDYMAVDALHGGETTPLLTLQRFIHVRPQGEPNTIRLHVTAESVEIRINDEVAANVPMNQMMLSDESLSISVFVETLDTGASSAAFEHLRVWQLEGAAYSCPGLFPPDAHPEHVTPRPGVLACFGTQTVVQPTGAPPQRPRRG